MRATVSAYLCAIEPPRAQKPDVGFVAPREAGREVGEALEPHLQVLARLASEEELLAADGRVDWFVREGGV